MPMIHNCRRVPKCSSVRPVKLVLEVLSPSVQPLLFTMDEISISNTNDFTNRSLPSSGVTYKFKQSLTNTWSGRYFHPSAIFTHQFSRPLLRFTFNWRCSCRRILFTSLQLGSWHICFIRSNNHCETQYLWWTLDPDSHSKPAAKCIVWLISSHTHHHCCSSKILFRRIVPAHICCD